jgi:dolichyl-phosphate beta-glucosyltransferase
MLLIGERLNMLIGEVPVTWHEVDGTKLNLLQDSIRMALDVVVIRLHHLLGLWRVREPVPLPAAPSADAVPHSPER